ncbi:tRNA-dihydrouridine(20) synthase [NAD(P)+] [Rhodotorula toruloides]|uniref:BY PROTMAP: gi/472588502/gb/EMS25974.1/ tRNA-dihydrouridine synthase 2 [Rhodosporidium toruloides NP11] gi/647396294/emb/CDR38331.1/ RHTO0S03e08328g1_1 [Rhodosporidium toruloides] n=2 Tax=Rhodotorula toruloides TaxID=5286 RepID=A0A0K3C7M5_RHOTO|nr:tRNA-dihydrouridine(20) synthase [NAD(P)+] [Rhodotorula toruloides]
MLKLVRSLKDTLLSPSTYAHGMSATRSHSPPTPSSSTSTDEPVAKRQRIEGGLADGESNGVNGSSVPEAPTKRKRTLPYEKGMHLAPMVRIGTLPVRLMSLEYGAELVWGPEIVDKAIIGSERRVDPKTGVVSFFKNNRSVFECHPVEKPRLIFQLGSASPEFAVQAMKMVENDVAGVGLNCGCPKSFSLSGGMGAALLKDPERLCSILKALVGATDLPIDAKIRLLPKPASSASASPAGTPASPAISQDSAPASPSAAAPTPSAVLEPTEPLTITIPPTEHASPSEPTLPLVAQIFDTGIANLTVHCRTQEMRSREPALHDRMRSITEMGRERGVPVVCNGDALGGGKEAKWGNFQELCEKTGVSSVMIARAAEANPSCFASNGLEDPIKVVIPRLLRIAVATNNHYSNTKYILNAMDLYSSPTPPSREVNRDLKQRMNKAKTYEDMCAIFGISEEEVKRIRETGVEEFVPEWVKRRKEIVEAEGEP